MFYCTLQKDFNLALEARPGTEDAACNSERAVRHFLFALEYYLEHLPRDQAARVEREIAGRELCFRRPKTERELASLRVDVLETGIVAWYGKALAFSGQLGLRDLYRFARGILPSDYFSARYMEWGQHTEPSSNLMGSVVRPRVEKTDFRVPGATALPRHRAG